MHIDDPVRLIRVSDHDSKRGRRQHGEKDVVIKYDRRCTVARYGERGQQYTDVYATTVTRRTRSVATHNPANERFNGDARRV